MINAKNQKNLHIHRILYIQYTNPAGYPSLGHSSRLLADEGWQVLFLGTGARGAKNLNFISHPNIVVRKLPFCPAGWFQKLHYAWFCFWGIWRALLYKPVCIYVSDILSCPVGLLLSYIPDFNIIYHEHDSPSTLSKGIFIRFCMKARYKLAQRSQACVLPNEERMLRFKRKIGENCKTFCVWNCPSSEEVSPSYRTSTGDILWVHYHGSIVPLRFPLTIVEALAILPEQIHLRIIGYETVGCEGYIKTLIDVAKRLGVSERICILDAMPREELMMQCQKSDVGLALGPKEAKDMNLLYLLGASVKPFDYLACGMALLVSDLPDWRTIYVEAGYGLACDPDDPRSIADALLWFLEHPEEMRLMGEKGRQRILKEWNYKKQFEPIFEYIKGIAKA